MFASDTAHQQSVKKNGSGMGRFFSTVRAAVHGLIVDDGEQTKIDLKKVLESLNTATA